MPTLSLQSLKCSQPNNFLQFEVSCIGVKNKKKPLLIRILQQRTLIIDQPSIERVISNSCGSFIYT